MIKDIYCQVHPGREAVAKCLSCQNYFCRECVTEHKGRLLCKACLAEDKTASVKGSGLFKCLRIVIALLIGLLLCYVIFYIIGYTLSIIPDTFH